MPQGMPRYRKLSNGMALYRIDSPTNVTELTRLGKRVLLHRLVAATWPDRVRIQEMLEDEGQAHQEATEEEFNNWLRAVEPTAPDAG